MNGRHPTREELQDHLDGRGTDEVRHHLGGCLACRHRLADAAELLEALRALPREVPPPEWVWTGLVARMGADALEDAPWDAPSSARMRKPRPPFRVVYRAAAVLLLCTAGAAGLHHFFGDGDGTGAAGAAREETAAVSGFESSLRSHEETSAVLSALFEERGSELPPDTRAALIKSLAELDRAIAGVRDALALYPDRMDLRLRLNRTYQWKIKMLERAVRLTAET